MVHPPAPHKQSIAKTVQVANRFGRDRFLARERYRETLCAATHCTGYMKLCVDSGSTGQDKASQRHERRGRFVNLALQLFHFDVGNVRLPGMNIFRESRENRA
jgi:hypothetical protein